MHVLKLSGKPVSKKEVLKMDKRMMYGALSSILVISALAACNDEDLNTPNEPEVNAHINGDDLHLQISEGIHSNTDVADLD